MSIAGENALHVPCGDCSECCQGHRREVDPRTMIPGVQIVASRGRWFLPWIGGDGGRCAYLSIDGTCRIYDRRPPECRQFDCRKFATDTRAPIHIRIAGVRKTMENWKD